MTDSLPPESLAPGGYLSNHLRGTRDGLGYENDAYAQKAWNTFGTCFSYRKDAPVLEIGPGECELALWLRDRQGYLNVSIIDRSAEVVELARRHRLDAVLSDDTERTLTEMPAAFETIVLLHVLEHVPKDKIIPLLRSIHMALRPGGSLLVEVPNMGDPLNGVHARYADFTHEVGFTEESLRYVLTEAGFGSPTFLDQAGALSRLGRIAQRASRRILHGLLFAANLPNGRQMRRRIGPVLSLHVEA